MGKLELRVLKITNDLRELPKLSSPMQRIVKEGKSRPTGRHPGVD